MRTRMGVPCDSVKERYLRENGSVKQRYRFSPTVCEFWARKDAMFCPRPTVSAVYQLDNKMSNEKGSLKRAFQKSSVQSGVTHAASISRR
jgi:hypothetical protein